MKLILKTALQGGLEGSFEGMGFLAFREGRF